MSIGFSAVVGEESLWVHVIFPGMFKRLEVALNTDQTFCCSILTVLEEIENQYCMRLVLTKDLADRRSSRNFPHSLGHDDVRLALFLHDSFFERRCLTS